MSEYNNGKTSFDTNELERAAMKESINKFFKPKNLLHTAVHFITKPVMIVALAFALLGLYEFVISFVIWVSHFFWDYNPFKFWIFTLKVYAVMSICIGTLLGVVYSFITYEIKE